MEIDVPEYQKHADSEKRDDNRLYVKLIVSFCNKEDDRRRKIETFFHRERPTLGDTGIPELVKETAQKGNV